MALMLAFFAFAPAQAQTWTSKVLGTNLGVSAMCKDASGNVYVVQTVSTAQNATQQNAQIVKYAAGTTTPTVLTGTTFQYSEYESVANYAFGLAIDGNGNLFVTTYNDYFPSDGRDATTYGKILKMTPTGGNSYTQSVWVNGQYPSGNKIGDFGALAIDSHNNLFVDTYNDVDGKYEIVEYPSGSTTPTVIYTHIGDPELSSGDHYTAFFAMAIDPSDNIYAGTSFDTDNNTDGGKIIQLTKGSNYATVNQVLAGGYCSALATDASGRLYATLANYVNGTGLTSSRIVKFASDFTSNTTLYTGLSHDGSYEPWGLAVPSSSMIFAGIGGGTVDGTGHLGDLAVLFSTPATPASNVAFSNINQSTVTISWTNGGGAARAVFVKAASTGTPTPVNSTTYTASTTFGSGTQAGSGWYCVYNGTGATVDITGLAANTAYIAMVVEYNGSASSENYNTTTGTNNPNTFTTVSPTTINSLNRVTSQYSNGATVNFAAVFGSAVTGVTASNFTVTATGVSGVTDANIGTPTTSDNITWTIPVTTGTGDGTIQLSLANATGLSKPITTSLPFAGQTYTIDKTPPTVTISAPSVTVANSTTAVSYTVTWADANINAPTESLSPLTAYNNRQVTGTATVNQVQTSVISGNSMTVTFSNITGDGTFNWSIPVNTARDLAGNQATAGAAPAQSVTIDNTAPTVVISRSDPNPIKDNVLDYQAVFNEPVTGVTASSFVMTNSGVTTGAISATMIDSKTYNITVATVAGTGTARLDLVAGGATDAAGNQAAAFNGGANATYDVDQTAPTATAITAANPSNATPTKATSVDYTVTFSEPVTGVDGSDFTAETTGSVSSGTISVTGSSDTYTVTVAGISGTGTLKLNLNASGTGIQDAAGNAISGGFTTGDTYNLDNTAPILTSGSYITNNGTSIVYAKTGDVVTLSFGANEALQTPVVTLGGQSMTPVNAFGNVWNTTHTVTAGDPDGHYPFAFTMTDLAGNSAAEISSATTGAYVTIDNTNPVPVISAPSLTVANPGGADVTYNVTYNEANFNSSSLSNSDITLNRTGTADGTVNVTGSGSNRTVTISGITGFGTLGITIGPGTATDLAGNVADASSPSTTFNVASNNAVLTKVSINPPIHVSQVTGPDFRDYTSRVGNSVTTVTFTPIYIGADNTMTVTVNGVAVALGTASDPITLNTGDNTINVVVTAQDGITQNTYAYKINRIPETSLTALITNPRVTLSTVAGPDFKDYTAQVMNSVNSITITPTTPDATNVIKVNGVTVASGTASAAIPLSVGDNTITTTVNDGTNTNTYSLVVTRKGPELSTLATNPVITLRAATGPDFKDYTATVANSTASLAIIPTALDPTSTIKVNDVTVASGAQSDPIALNVGDNTINTVVTSQDGTVSYTYSIKVTRQAAAVLAALTFNPDVTLRTVSGPDFKDYTAQVMNSVNSVTVTPKDADATNTIMINGATVASGTASNPIMLNIGDNTITTTVSDGTVTNTYSVVLTRKGPELSSIATNPVATLRAVAGADFKDYTATVTNSVSSISIIPTALDPTSTIKVNDVAVASGAQSDPIALNVGDNTINTVVTSQDGNTSYTYSIKVTRQSASVLASLTFSPNIPLSAVTGPDFKDYTARVGNSISSVTVTPKSTDPTNVIQVNGVTVASGTASDPIALSVGDNTIVTTITDGTTTNAYSVKITRTAAASLTTLALNPQLPLKTVTGPDFKDYTATAANSITSVTITPTSSDVTNVIKVNNVTVASGMASADIPLNIGANTITTTVSDGTVTNTYSVVITRNGPELSSLATNPVATLRAVAGADFKDYTATVTNSVSSISIIPTALDPTSTIKVNDVAVASGAQSDPIALNVGDNTINTVVTSQDGNTSYTYSIKVTRQSASVLASLTFSPNIPLSAVTGPDFKDYTSRVGNSISSVTVTPKSTDPANVIQVNGLTVVSGTASDPIALNVGDNTVVTTISDGTTTNTYSVKITRLAPSILSTLTLNPKLALKTVTGPDFKDYTTTADNSVSSVTLTAVAGDATNSIQINGMQAVSGTPSADIPLAVGDNTITTTVSDGVTTNVYSITITRLAPAAGFTAYQQNDQSVDPIPVAVHQNLSPNGDGNSDHLQIDGIDTYPDNKLQIMSRSGELIYEVKGYDNQNKVFDGHSTNGKLQQPGTYFYSLEYKSGNETKRKTGYFVLKY